MASHLESAASTMYGPMKRANTKTLLLTAPNTPRWTATQKWMVASGARANMRVAQITGSATWSNTALR